MITSPPSARSISRWRAVRPRVGWRVSIPTTVTSRHGVSTSGGRRRGAGCASSFVGPGPTKIRLRRNTCRSLRLKKQVQEPRQSLGPTSSARHRADMAVPGVTEQRGFRLVGYTDMDGRPAFKLATHRSGDRRYLYTGHFWHHGWSIVDVTDPTAPRVINFVEGPADTWTLQVQVANGTMITSLEAPSEGWGIA